MRTVLGEPTGTSTKFASMMAQALEEFQERHGVKFEKVTQMPLEGEGTISKRVDKCVSFSLACRSLFELSCTSRSILIRSFFLHRLYTALAANEEWMSDLHAADVVFVATHSQGSIVSTHLLDRLIQDKHIRTAINVNEAAETSEIVKDAALEAATGVGGIVAPSSRKSERKKQRVCCLCLCGIHLGPLRYLSSSSLVLPYIQVSTSSPKSLVAHHRTFHELPLTADYFWQYFESTAAKELFEFQVRIGSVSFPSGVMINSTATEYR